MAEDTYFDTFMRAYQAPIKMQQEERALQVEEARARSGEAEARTSELRYQREVGLQEQQQQQLAAMAGGMADQTAGPTAGTTAGADDLSSRRTALQKQTDQMYQMARMMMTSDPDQGRKIMKDASAMDANVSKMRVNELKAHKDEISGLASVLDSVSDQASFTRALMFGASGGMDISPIMQATGGQYNEETKAYLETLIDSTMETQEKVDMDMRIATYENNARLADSLIQNRRDTRTQSQQTQAVQREGLQVKREATRATQASAESTRIRAEYDTEYPKAMRTPVQMTLLKRLAATDPTSQALYDKLSNAPSFEEYKNRVTGRTAAPAAQPKAPTAITPPEGWVPPKGMDLSQLTEENLRIAAARRKTSVAELKRKLKLIK